MTKSEFSQAVKLVESGVDLTKYDDSNLYGCGLSGFQPVHTTLGAVARIVAWQARTFAGTWDAAALDEMAQIAKKKFLIVGN